jgi:hypothetical protein
VVDLDINRGYKMDRWLYFHVFDDDREVVVCCVKENILAKQDLVDFDAFLAYYGQNYKVRGSNFEEGVSHTCASMKCVRGHVIDANIIR